MIYTCAWCGQENVNSQHTPTRGKDGKYCHDAPKNCWQMFKLADRIDTERLEKEARDGT